MPGPRVSPVDLHRLRRNAPRFLARLPGVPPDQVFRQERRIVAAVAKRGNPDGVLVEPVVQVRPVNTLRDHLLVVPRRLVSTTLVTRSRSTETTPSPHKLSSFAATPQGQVFSTWALTPITWYPSFAGRTVSTSWSNSDRLVHDPVKDSLASPGANNLETSFHAVHPRLSAGTAWCVLWIVIM